MAESSFSGFQRERYLITPFSQRSLDGEGAEMLLDFKKAHQQDLKVIAEILARISHQSP